jgi:hypothetical protein
MFLAVIIIGALILSATLNTAIKGYVYDSVIRNLGEDIPDEPTTGMLLTALGVIIVNNMIPLTLGCMIGLYAIM